MAMSGGEILSLSPVAAAAGVGGGRFWSGLWLPSRPARMVFQRPLTARRTHIFYVRRAQSIRRRRRQSWRCEVGPEPDTSSPQPEKVPEEAAGSNSNKNSSSLMEGPIKETNRVIALTSAMAAIGLFLFTRAGLSGATLGELAASAIPYEEALSNGKPTVVEFYADWCEVCREMAPDVYKVEQQYKGQVNFVMLNVDNNKWEEELDEFGVEGIPHFAFLDMKGNEEGNVVGRLPKKYLEDNVVALAKGGGKLPHTRIVGQFSSAESRQTSKVGEPTSHGI